MNSKTSDSVKSVKAPDKVRFTSPDSNFEPLIKMLQTSPFFISCVVKRLGEDYLSFIPTIPNIGHGISVPIGLSSEKEVELVYVCDKKGMPLGHLSPSSAFKQFSVLLKMIAG